MLSAFPLFYAFSLSCAGSWRVVWLTKGIRKCGIFKLLRSLGIHSASLCSQSPNFETFDEAKNRFQGTDSGRLCSLAWRAGTTTLYSYSVPSPHRLFKNSSTGAPDNPFSTRFLAPIDCSKISDTAFNGNWRHFKQRQVVYLLYS